MNNTHSIGTVLQLKSGSPLMTVVSKANEYDTLQCGWFTGSEYSTSFFPLEALKPAQTP